MFKESNKAMRSLYRLMVSSSVFLLLYGFYAGCGKKKDLKDELREQKIISLAEASELSSDGDNPFSGNKEAIERGKGHYMVLCTTCHGPDARGNTGPDLLDDIWLHGADNFSVYNLLMNGVNVGEMKMNPPRGKMPAYRDILGGRKILELMAWLESARSKVSNVPGE